MFKRIKSYGERYAFASVKVKISKKKVFIVIFAFLVVTAIVLGVLWALGY